MSRSVPEWVGKDDDSRPPRLVRARVFRKYKGRCYLTGRSIGVKDEWDLEHVRPLHLARDGENLNRESNLAPALKAAHAVKTAAEATGRSKADRIHAKHFGYWPETKAKLRGRGFQRTRPVLP
jgi:5-methylcytosine-specific restriction enzyme A